MSGRPIPDAAAIVYSYRLRDVRTGYAVEPEHRLGRDYVRAGVGYGLLIVEGAGGWLAAIPLDRIFDLDLGLARSVEGHLFRGWSS